jgi:hypothetical protein
MTKPRIRIYVPDLSYDTGRKFVSSAGKSITFKKYLEAKFERKFSYENLGAGADWPSYFTTIKDLSPFAVTGSLAIFFSGKLVKENIEAWTSLAKSLRAFFKLKPIVEREAAALRAVDKIVHTHRLKLREFKLLAYSQNHIGLLRKEKTRKPKGIADNSLPINLGDKFHNFLIEVNGKPYHVIVTRDKTEILD